MHPALLCLLLVPAPAFGAEFTVSPTGDDAGDNINTDHAVWADARIE